MTLGVQVGQGMMVLSSGWLIRSIKACLICCLCSTLKLALLIFIAYVFHEALYFSLFDQLVLYAWLTSYNTTLSQLITLLIEVKRLLIVREVSQICTQKVGVLGELDR